MKRLVTERTHIIRGTRARVARRGRFGLGVIYLMFMMTALVGFASLAVDWGRVQLAKSQLQHAADAAARFGALGLENDADTARANAVAAAADNSSDGVTVVVDPNLDVEFGTWDANRRTFTVVAAGNEDLADAIRVYARRTAAKGNAVPLFFARAVGRDTIDVNVFSVCTYTRGTKVTLPVPGSSNIWLAGEPSGTKANVGNPHNNPDQAGNPGNPKQSPVQITSVSIVPGQTLTFDSINGGANNFQTTQMFTPDGNTGWIVSNFGGAELGKSDAIAPINAVMGVFVDDSVPSSSPPPSVDSDFGTQASRDFQTLKPALKQVFFIGDGRRDNGTTQQFVVPPGATRLFVGTMDGYEWNNNVGSYTVTAHRVGNVKMVK